MEGVSIVVCCYNSASRIDETIKHLTLLSHPNIAFEIILVNNASKDNTSAVAINSWEQWYDTQYGEKVFRIVDEYIPGLTAARKRGVQEALYKHLIFVDDDNWLNADYITEAQQIFDQYPNAAVVGGQGIPYFENNEKPEWFDSKKNWYAVGKQGGVEGIITRTRGFVYGAAAFWKTDVLKEIFKRRLWLTDRLGNKLTSGGDSELCFNAVLMGYDIAYSSKLIFTHFIPQERLTVKYIDRMISESARGNLLLHGYLYKLGTHEHTFNKPIKRTWWGQLSYRLYYLMFTKTIIYKRDIIELVYLNFKYDKIFKE